MDIKLRYDEDRVGGYQIRPIKIYKKDMEELIKTHEYGVGTFPHKGRLIIGRMLSHSIFKDYLLFYKRGYAFLLEVQFVNEEKMTILFLTGGTDLVSADCSKIFEMKYLFRWVCDKIVDLPFLPCKIAYRDREYFGIEVRSGDTAGGIILEGVYWESKNAIPRFDLELPMEGFW